MLVNQIATMIKTFFQGRNTVLHPDWCRGAFQKMIEKLVHANT